MSELGQWFKVTYQSGLVLPSDRLVTLIPVTHVGEAGHETKYREEQVPNWVRERVSLLRLVEPGTDIGGVGKRHSKEVFFIKRENSL